MKIILESTKKSKVVEEFATIAAVGLGIVALIAGIVALFYRNAKKIAEQRAAELERATQQAQSVIQEEPNIPPQQKQGALQQINSAIRELTASLEKINKEATQVKDAAKMSEKPSVLIEAAISAYQQKLNEITATLKVGPKGQAKLQQAMNMIQSAKQTLGTIDHLSMMANQNLKGGLWKEVISKHKSVSAYLNKGDRWIRFVSELAKEIKTSNTQVTPQATGPAPEIATAQQPS